MKKTKVWILVVVVALILAVALATLMILEPCFFSLRGEKGYTWTVSDAGKAKNDLRRYAGADAEKLFEDCDFKGPATLPWISVTTDRPVIVCWFAPQKVKWEISMNLYGSDRIEEKIGGAVSTGGALRICVRALSEKEESSLPIVFDRSVNREKTEEGNGTIDAAYEIRYKNMRLELRLGAVFNGAAELPKETEDALLEAFDGSVEKFLTNLSNLTIKT